MNVEGKCRPAHLLAYLVPFGLEPRLAVRAVAVCEALARVRIGQKDSVLVQHLVLQDSLDARMVRVLIKKQRVIDATLDGDPGRDLFDMDLAEDLIEASSEDEPVA